MKVKIKKLSQDAVIPKYANKGDAGLDFTAISMTQDANKNYVYHTGISLEIPEGFVGLIFPRSSLCKKDLYLTNHVGVIDSGFRGEILFKFKSIGKMENFYNIGDKIGQLIILPYPQIEFEEVDFLTNSERDKKGFGSTDEQKV